MNYETIDGAIDRIDDAIANLKVLKGQLTNILLDDTNNSIQNLQDKIDPIMTELESVKTSMPTTGEAMQAIAEYFEG